MKSDISVIIVGLNACGYLRDCVLSLQKAEWRGRSREFIYVDNGSTDDTLAMLKSEYPEVTVIANPANLGFCIASNQGAAIANGRHLFFLNDDTVVYDDAICLLSEFLDTVPAGGVAGSRLLNPDGTDQWSGRRFATPANAIFGRRSVLSKIFPNAAPVAKYLMKAELQSGNPFVVDWVSAAAMMVDRETFAAVGGFAEDYYYFHEAVICRRIQRKGRSIYLHPRSQIMHYEGKGSGKRPYPVQRRHIINFHQGAYRWFCEHHNLGPMNPLRWLAKAVIGARAALLITGKRLATLRELHS
jgi:GT2 family glycosyltransferase